MNCHHQIGGGNSHRGGGNSQFGGGNSYSGGGNSQFGGGNSNNSGGGRGSPRGGRGSRRGRTSTGQIICYGCGRTGHIAANCPDVAAKVVDVDDDQPEDDVTMLFAAKFNNVNVVDVKATQAAGYPTCTPIMTQIKFGDKKVPMECDTAASHNILSQQTYQDIWPRGSGPRLQYHNVKVMLGSLEPSANITFTLWYSVV